MTVSVQPEWCTALPVQQQSVLFLGARGPDGVRKDHPCKAVVRAYRGTVLVAAKYGRPLNLGELSIGDDFMSLDRFARWDTWNADRDAYFAYIDELPHHYHMHLMHGAQILGYKHPQAEFRSRWLSFYQESVHDLHLNIESENEMDHRLNDWERVHW